MLDAINAPPLRGSWADRDRQASWDQASERLRLTVKFGAPGPRSAPEASRGPTRRRRRSLCAPAWCSTFCGRSRPRSWTPQLGGERAYRGSPREGPSPRQSGRSIASAKQASPPFCDVPNWLPTFQVGPLAANDQRKIGGATATAWPDGRVARSLLLGLVHVVAGKGDFDGLAAPRRSRPPIRTDQAYAFGGWNLQPIVTKARCHLAV